MVIIKQHPYRSALFIIVLAPAYIPDESAQEKHCYQQAGEYEKDDNAHWD